MGNCLPNPLKKKDLNKINKTKKKKAKQRENERRLPEHSERYVLQVSHKQGRMILTQFNIAKEFSCLLRSDRIDVTAATKFKSTKSDKMGHESKIPVIIW